jgi:hypothetical protein
MLDYFVEELNPDNEKDWEQFNEKTDGGSFFHTLKWKNILERSLNFKSHYFLIYNNDRVISICPFYENKLKGFRGLMVLPDSDYHNILIDNNVTDHLFFNKILKKTKEIAKKSKLIFISITTLKEDIQNSFNNFSPLKYPLEGNMILDINKNKPEKIWREIFNRLGKGKPRERIRKFEIENFTLNEANSIEDLKIFYKYYKENLEYKNLNAFLFTHFEQLWKMYSKNEMRITLLQKNDVYYGGLLAFLYSPKKTLYMRYFSLNRNIAGTYSPSYYLYWDAILKASELGFNTVSFGATPLDINSINYRTKIKFGCIYEKQYSVIFPLSSLFKLSYKTYTFLKKY